MQGGRLEPVPQRPTSGSYVVVRTEFHGDGLRGTAKLRLTGGTIPDRADAAFTTQSAFEKFVLPYYVRTKPIDELKDMLDKFFDKKVICAYHDPSSEIDTVESGIYLLHDDGTRELI